jgi:hypothetical protein
MTRAKVFLQANAARFPLLPAEADISPKRQTSRFDPLRTKAGPKFRGATSP